MAFAAVAALAAGAEVTATLVLSAAAEIGTAMTVIGAVTGSKELMKIGGAVALIGGIGGMVAGAAGGAAVGSEAAGAVTNEAASAADYVSGLDAMSDAATAGTQSSGIIGSETAGVGADLSTPALQTPAQEMAQATQPVAPSTPSSAATPPSTVTQQAPDVQVPQAPQGPAGATAPNGPSNPYDNIDVGGGYNPASNSSAAPQDSSSFFGKFSDWANKNSKLFSTGMQLAGGALNGMNQRQMWDQKMALERQRLAQTSYGSQVGVWAPNPQPGIVNGARR